MRKHIFVGANRIATRGLSPQGTVPEVHYYHSDHLGSSNVITDESGSQAAHYEYTPYGSVIASPEAPNGVIASPAGAKQSPIAHLFTDKELDNTGLYFFEARYYDPELAHFTSPDSIAGLDDPQNLNPYSYCLNDPINYTDPTGNSPEDSVIELGIIYVNPNSTYGDNSPSSSWGVLGDINSSYSVNPGNINNFAYQPILSPGYSSFGNNLVVNAAQNFLVDSATIKGGAQLIQGADYSTPQGWLEGGVGAIGIAAATADAGLNFATGGVKGAVKGASLGIKKITVIGSRLDTLKYIGKKGYNVLNIKNWTPKKNLKFINDAIKRGDLIKMVTDPLKHQELMKRINKWSAFIDLELPELLEKGFRRR